LGHLGHLAVDRFALLEPDQPVFRVGLADRKSTRLNSSHLGISYAVFCLKTFADYKIVGTSVPRVDIPAKATRNFRYPPVLRVAVILLFFFNDTATTEIYTLSLHDALPISRRQRRGCRPAGPDPGPGPDPDPGRDRKSTRLNSSHLGISYAVFCLKIKH